MPDPAHLDPAHLDPADPATAHHLAQLDSRAVIAWFGAFDAMNRPQRLVQAVHILATYHEPDALILMAGPVADPFTARAVDRYVAELGLVGSWIAPDVPGPIVEAFRGRADVIVAGPVPDVPAIVLAAALGRALERTPDRQREKPDRQREKRARS